MKNHVLKFSIPLAILLTLSAIIYQRSTGPTYPRKFYIGLSDETKVRVKMPRSHGGTTDAKVEIPKIEKLVSAQLVYKRYPVQEDWKTVDLILNGSQFEAPLPNQPPAGKLSYYVVLRYDNGDYQELGDVESPIIIRFKGDVPVYILAPHIFFMFLSMFFSALALFEALFRTQLYVRIGRWTLGCLVFGGLVLGPLVQKYAFGVYWAGFPYGTDLTDNKLLVGVLAWTFGVLATMKWKVTWPTIFAALVLVGVYSIPHSMRGSQYNYETGKVETVKH